MSEYRKMAFVGDVGSGKTTIIRTLSEIEVVDTDRRTSIDIGKEFTTVGIDYGRINLTDKMALGLYGVPGQKRYALLWEHVNQSLWGLAILVKYTLEPNLDVLAEALDFFDPARRGTPFIVGLTHADTADKEDLESVLDVFKAYLLERDLPGVVLAVDCKDHKSAMAIPYFINSVHNAKARAEAG